MLKKILLINEGHEEAGLFKEALFEVSPRVAFYYAENGHDAIKKLKRGKAKNPGIIFLDIDRPVMNGWQFLKEIKSRERFRHIPVIMYSKSSRKHEINQAIEMGAFGFFSKPDKYEQLKSKLHVITDAFGTGGKMSSQLPREGR